MSSLRGFGSNAFPAPRTAYDDGEDQGFTTGLASHYESKNAQGTRLPPGINGIQTAPRKRLLSPVNAYNSTYSQPTNPVPGSTLAPRATSPANTPAAILAPRIPVALPTDLDGRRAEINRREMAARGINSGTFLPPGAPASRYKTDASGNPVTATTTWINGIPQAPTRVGENTPEGIEASRQGLAAQHEIRAGSAYDVNDVKNQALAPKLAQDAADEAKRNTPAALEDRKALNARTLEDAKASNARSLADQNNAAKAKLTDAQVEAHLKALGLEGENKIAVQKMIGNTQQDVAATKATASAGKTPANNKGEMGVYVDVYKHAIASEKTPAEAHAAARGAVEGYRSMSGGPQVQPDQAAQETKPTMNPDGTMTHMGAVYDRVNGGWQRRKAPVTQPVTQE